MNRDDYVAEYGGKAGLHKFLRDTGEFDRHLLPTVYVRPEENLAKALRKINLKDGTPHIVRASHRCDFYGLVDVLETTKQVTDAKTLRSVAQRTRAQAKQDDVMTYALDEDPSYDGNVTVMVQPEVTWVGELEPEKDVKYRGSIVEHPGQRGTYVVTIVSRMNLHVGSTGFDIHKTLVNTEEELKEDPGVQGTGFSSQTHLCRQGLKIIDLYKRVQDALGYEGSLQMEFGINKKFPDLDETIFHQARWFKPFAAANFEIPNNDPTGTSFGTTSPEGIVLDVILTEDVRQMPQGDAPFLWIPKYISQGDKLKITPVPKNMKGFLTMRTRGKQTDSLEHNVYRFLQKADVSVLAFPQTPRFIDPREHKRVRWIANGVQSQILPA